MKTRSITHPFCNLFNKKSYTISFISLITITLLLAAKVSFAAGAVGGPLAMDPDPNSDGANFVCANSSNLADCLDNQQKQQAQSQQVKDLSVSTALLGFNSPVEVSVRYDDKLKTIAALNYAHAFINNAIGLKLDGGANEARANITLAHAFNANNQAKVTYEFLAQNRDFNYTTGTVKKWVDQNAFGVDLRHLLPGSSLIHSLDLTGSYIKAQSKNLSTVNMANGDQDLRRIAGGQEENAGLGMTVTPGSQTSIDLGGGYSHIKYDTRYEDNHSHSIFAYSAKVNQLITCSTKLTASTNRSAADMDNKVSLSQILPHHLEATLTGEYDIGYNGLSNQRSIMLGANYPAPKCYTLTPTDTLGSLADWVRTPAVYETQVLAIKDEKILHPKMVAEPIAITVATNHTITPLNTSQMFKSSGGYDQIKYLLSKITGKDSQGNPIHIEGVPSGSSAADATPTNCATTRCDFIVDQLGLRFDYIDDSHYQLISSAPMPAGALAEGDKNNNYSFTIEASEYLGGTKLSTATNDQISMKVTAGGYNQPTWKNGGVLPAATLGQTDYSVDLNSYINGAQGEQFTYKVQDSSTWQLASDGHTLEPVSGTVPDQETKVTVIATSQQSGISSDPANSVLTIPVDGLLWSNIHTIKGPTMTIATGKQEIVLDPSAYLDDYNINDAYSYTVENAPTGWNASFNGTTLTIDTAKVSSKCTVSYAENNIPPECAITLTAKDTTNGYNSSKKTFDLVVQTNPNLSYAWTNSTLADATAGQNYSNSQGLGFYLTSSSASQYNPNLDAITFKSVQLEKGSQWLNVSNEGTLSGMPAIQDSYANQIQTVTLHSQAAGQDITVSGDLAIKVIVDLMNVPTTFVLYPPQQPYYAANFKLAESQTYKVVTATYANGSDISVGIPNGELRYEPLPIDQVTSLNQVDTDRLVASSSEGDMSLWVFDTNEMPEFGEVKLVPQYN